MTNISKYNSVKNLKSKSDQNLLNLINGKDCICIVYLVKTIKPDEKNNDLKLVSSKGKLIRFYFDL